MARVKRKAPRGTSSSNEKGTCLQSLAGNWSGGPALLRGRAMESLGSCAQIGDGPCWLRGEAKKMRPKNAAAAPPNPDSELDNVLCKLLEPALPEGVCSWVVLSSRTARLMLTTFRKLAARIGMRSGNAERHNGLCAGKVADADARFRAMRRLASCCAPNTGRVCAV